MVVSLFDNLCKSYLVESTLEETNKTLCSDVWEDPYNFTKPRLKYDLQQEITKGIEIAKNFYIPEKSYIVGGILTVKGNEQTNIDIVLLFMGDTTTEDRTKIIKIVNALNENIKSFRDHSIHFIAMFDAQELNSYNAIYDFSDLEWIKQPQNNKQGKLLQTLNNIDKIILSATNTIEFDYHINKIIETMTTNSLIKLNELVLEKYRQIVKESNLFVDAEDKISSNEKETFKKTLTPQKIKEHKNLPKNITDKLLERYYYFRLSKTIAENIQREKEDSLNENLQHNVNHRHRRFAGGLNSNRKSLNVVPDYVKVNPSRNKSVDDIRNGKISFKSISKFEAANICKQYNCQIPTPGNKAGLGKTNIWLFNDNNTFTLRK